MDGAWSNDNEEAILLISAVDNSDRFVASSNDGSLRLRCLWNFVLKETRWGERVIAAD